MHAGLRGGDSTIRDPVPNDIAGLLEKSAVRAVFTTGEKRRPASTGAFACQHRAARLLFALAQSGKLPGPKPKRDTDKKDYQILLEYLC